MNNWKRLFTCETDLKSEKGFSLIAAVAIVVGFGLMALLITRLIIADAELSTVQTSKQKTFYIAEAGIEYSLGILADSSDWRGTSSNITVGEGEFSVTVDDKTTIPALGDTLLVTSSGSTDKFSKTIQMRLIINHGWLNVLHAGDDVDLSKGKGKVKGDVHANDLVTVGWKYTIDGKTSSGPPYIDLPTIDWNFFKNLAIAAGQYSTSDLTFSGNNKNYSGVWYTTNSIKIEGNNNVFHGTLIAEDDITIKKNNNEVYATPSSYPAMAAGDDITIEMNNTVVFGMVYGGGDIKLKKNNGEFTGAIIAGDTFKNEGNNLEVELDPAYVTDMVGVTIPDDQISVEKLSWTEF